MSKRGARGFVYYDLWILVVLIAIVAAVIVPAVYRGVRKARLRRAEFAALQQIADAQRASYDREKVYLDSLPFALAGGLRLLTLRRDSSGWGAAVTGDSLQAVRLSCGVFEGPALLAPDSAVTDSGRITCW